MLIRDSTDGEQQWMGYEWSASSAEFIFPLLLLVATFLRFHPIMSNYYSEEIYEGPEAIVVAMDIGTTHSEQGLSDWASLMESFRRSIVRLLRTRYSSSSTNGTVIPQLICFISPE